MIICSSSSHCFHSQQMFLFYESKSTVNRLLCWVLGNTLARIEDGVLRCSHHSDTPKHESILILNLSPCTLNSSLGCTLLISWRHRGGVNEWSETFWSLLSFLMLPAMLITLKPNILCKIIFIMGHNLMVHNLSQLLSSLLIMAPARCFCKHWNSGENAWRGAGDKKLD